MFKDVDCLYQNQLNLFTLILKFLDNYVLKKRLLK